MRKDLVDATIKAIDAMIESELESTSVGRYGRIRFLCDTAGNLLQRAIARVGAAVDLDNDPEVLEQDAGMLRLGRATPATDLGELTREMISALTSMSKPRALPIPFTSPTDELMRLLDLRERLIACGRPTENVDKKIATIEESFDKEPIVSLVELAPDAPLPNEADRCEARDSHGVQCELLAGHAGTHACPKALSHWLGSGVTP
jgi:hypothetical protein